MGAFDDLTRTETVRHIIVCRSEGADEWNHLGDFGGHRNRVFDNTDSATRVLESLDVFTKRHFPDLSLQQIKNMSTALASGKIKETMPDKYGKVYGILKVRYEVLTPNSLPLVDRP